MKAAFLALGCAIAVAVMTGVVRQLAARYGVLDIPNSRSSHQQAVPRAGGLAVALTVLAVGLALALDHRLPGMEALVWLGGGALIATVGLLDDCGGLSVRTRLVAQIIAAAGVVWISDPPHFAGNSALGQLAVWLGGTVFVVWAINLFNFMDGIDGLAPQQALFVSVSALWLAAGGPESSTGLMLAAIAGAAAGFLVWNWAPARIFLGDVGSGFLGFALALAAVTSSRHGSTSLWSWLILQGAFFVDASVTVSARLLRRVRVYEAHRQHAYQRLARHWGSHARVSLAYLAVNFLWLLPLAAIAAARPGLAPWLTLAALLPPVGLAVLIGAGHPGEISKAGLSGKEGG